MTDPTDQTADDSTITPNRRTLLGALGGAAGATAFANPISRAKSAVGEVADEHADDPPTPDVDGGGVAQEEYLCTLSCGTAPSGDWSTGEITLAACSQGNGGEAIIEVTGKIGPDPSQEPTGQAGGGGKTTTQTQTVAAEQEQATGDGTSQEQTVIVEQHQTVIHRCDDGGGGGGGEEHAILFDATHQGDDWTVTEYYLEVTGELEPSEYDDASIDPELDLWDDASGVSHTVANHKDAYVFTGEIRELEVDGPANVFLDGNQIDPNNVGGGGGNSGGDGPSHVTVSLDPGEERTLWYTGTISHMHMSHDDINIAIANSSG